MGDKDIDNFDYVETNQCVSATHTLHSGSTTTWTR